ncbi:MAG: ABC transporter permease [Burkholderiales bacterium]|jgi:spermidine/putrescine transport system permease protein|nr:ABC transporter permease [Burkholderiales bacterium]
MSQSNSSRIRGERLVKYSVITPPFLFLLTFFLVPALIMVVASFRYPGEFGGLAPLFRGEDGVGGVTLENYKLFFSSTNYAWIFLRSFGVAALTTVICLFMAYPVALLVARSPKKSRDLLVLLCVLPFASNFLVRVYAWMIIFQPFDLMHSRLAVIIGMVYVHLPFMILPLYTNLEKHDPTLLDAAQDLGANAWHRFWRVTFPMSIPGIFSGALLVFIPVLGMFAIPEILGGKNDWLVGNMIKDAFLGSRDWPFGSMLSMVMTIAVLAAVGLATALAKKGVPRA